LRESVKYSAHEDSATQRPATTASSRPTTPKMVASVILPGRILYMYSPISSARGIVTAMVNTPHGLSLSAFTNATPTPARAITMMNRIAMPAVNPATGPIWVRASSASEAPF
jgi:hypothetical protein